MMWLGCEESVNYTRTVFMSLQLRGLESMCVFGVRS